MKKKRGSSDPWSSLNQTLLKMKLTVFILLLSIMGALASKSYSQTNKLTMNVKDVRVEDFLKMIEDQSLYRFFYSGEINVDQKMSGDFTNATIDEILDKALESKGIKYEITGRQVILSSAVSPLVANQSKTVTGKVTDSSGQPLPGVTVVVKGTTQGIITDADGKYSLPNVPADATLMFSFVGMKSQEVSVSGKVTVNVKLVEDAIGIEEVVAIGYGTMKKGNLTGAIASVKSEDLVKSPVASTSNALAGRLPGLISLQSGGQPGNDAASLSIRGFGNALVLVDGVEGSFNNLDANQIESISILKDGSAAIYGSRAGNGVILVTTKRGDNQKPTITYKSSYTLQGITNMPKPCSSGQSTELIRESWVNAGSVGIEPYTVEEIQKYYEATDPQYPNTDWYNYLIRDWAPQHQHNLSVRGGSDRVRYYGFLGYMNQETIWKKSGGDYTRYNLQSNLDAKILDNLSLQLDISSTIEAQKFPWRPMDIGIVWSDFWATRPMFPATLPDPTKISYAEGGGTGGAHITTNRDISGYNDTDNQNIKGSIALNYHFKSIKGLSAKAFANYNKSYINNKTFMKPVNFYKYDYASDIYTLGGSLGNNSLSMTRSLNRVVTGQFSLNYDNTFGDHHLSGLVLYELIDYYDDWLSAQRKNFLTSSIDQMFGGSTTDMSNDGSANEMGRESIIGRFNYSYKNKYLVEATFRADASAKFSSNDKWGYFPGLSLGWRISEENFMKHFSFLDDLKLRTSYGSSGNDNVVNFQYLTGYNLGTITTGGTYLFGTTTAQGLVSKGLANPYLTWEKIDIYDVGMDFSLWNKRLYGEMDVFYRQRTGIPATRITTLPSTFGATLPAENINSIDNRGFELQIGTTGESRGLKWDISGNISWSRAKWIHYEEPVYSDPDQARIYTLSGLWTDKQYGYVSDGLFTSQDEIDNLGYDQDNKGNVSLRPGDIKYKDINDDKIVNWKDQVIIGKGTTPHWMVGFNTDLQYKNFDFSALFQGAMGFYNYVTLKQSAVPTENYYELRWTESNNDADAFIPRLGGAASSSWTSDHYYKKAGYLRLKTISIGYNISKRWLAKFNIKEARIYTAGINVLTFSKLGKYGIDPESPSGQAGYYYPQQKTITLGINLSL
ncbi:MAG: SusC/RagA family TonB-linked outer membrane protein [Bacteroidetes bacterium GWF2_42_66]|nr:MAG: SusC/RagA family TonB-linked outer membrane protein [Bacteroidetes bacterium GWA2_42_15]OFY00584.1 MAG: SusC/RagA family TonB-linked outer membrane protein [Bacteroidetes bacterium GWE2_42_39]OFY42318.1 MAG: SusC/RagA family TonB-linked outer membrane protein [Bacteroidetes bacterium GWF2_42_66]